GLIVAGPFDGRRAAKLRHDATRLAGHHLIHQLLADVALKLLVERLATGVFALDHADDVITSGGFLDRPDLAAPELEEHGFQLRRRDLAVAAAGAFALAVRAVALVVLQRELDEVLARPGAGGDFGREVAGLLSALEPARVDEDVLPLHRVDGFELAGVLL